MDPTEYNSVESAAESYDQNISSPFLLTNPETTKNGVLNDTSLLKSPFLVKNESNNLIITNLQMMFDLKVIFQESVFYPFNQQYKSDKKDPNKLFQKT